MKMCVNHKGYTGGSDECPTCNPGQPSSAVARTVAELYDADGAHRIAAHLRMCADAFDQVGSHGNPSLSEASGSAQSEAKKTNSHSMETYPDGTVRTRWELQPGAKDLDC